MPLGLTDQDNLLNLMFESDAKSQLKKLFKDNANHFWADEGMSEALKDELVSDFGEEAAEEALHLLPLVGQIPSVGSGVFGCFGYSRCLGRHLDDLVLLSR